MTMRTDPAHRKITAGGFLAMDFSTDRPIALQDGVVAMMAERTEAHARVQGNLLFASRTALAGSGYRPCRSDMAVQTGATDIRYPDSSIHRGPQPDTDPPLTALHTPIVIVEVLSPGRDR